MTIKFQLSSIAILVGGIALTGCAGKQTWSPELEDARETFQQVSSDPQVAEFASAELESARKQLQDAENASDYFRGIEEISHEAALAKLKALEAQETARGLAAKGYLRMAQAGVQQPIMAAATPVITSSASGSANGGHTSADSPLSETQIIAQQLAALSEQITQLQNRVANGALETSSQTANTPSTNYSAATFSPAASQAATTASEIENEIRLEAPSQWDAAEPQLAAAMAAPAAIPQVNENLSEARLQEELRAMNAKPSGRGMSLTLGERYFESNSARIWNGRAARHLDNIASVMSENPSIVVDIEAHTDNSQPAEYSHNLTSDRAIAVKSALVLRGVSAGRINTIGYGDTAPVADNSTELGKLQNRRVEIIFPNAVAQ